MQAYLENLRDTRPDIVKASMRVTKHIREQSIKIKRNGESDIRLKQDHLEWHISEALKNEAPEFIREVTEFLILGLDMFGIEYDG